MWIGAVTLALLFLWFRYMCRTVLSAKPARDWTDPFADRHGFRYHEVLRDIPKAKFRTLALLHQAVTRDYARVDRLLHQSPASPVDHLVRADFRYLSWLFPVARILCVPAARAILREMTRVVEYLVRSASRAPAAN